MVSFEQVYGGQASIQTKHGGEKEWEKVHEMGTFEVRRSQGLGGGLGTHPQLYNGMFRSLVFMNHA